MGTVSFGFTLAVVPSLCNAACVLTFSRCTYGGILRYVGEDFNALESHDAHTRSRSERAQTGLVDEDGNALPSASGHGFLWFYAEPLSLRCAMPPAY